MKTRRSAEKEQNGMWKRRKRKTRNVEQRRMKERRERRKKAKNKRNEKLWKRQMRKNKNTSEEHAPTDLLEKESTDEGSYEPKEEETGLKDIDRRLGGHGKAQMNRSLIT